MIYYYIFGSVILVSLISLIIILPFLKILNNKKVLISLLSLSVGILFGGVFIHIIPEAIELNGYNLNLSLYIILGFFSMFLIERIIHYRHSCHKIDGNNSTGHHHAYHLGIMNLIGDGVHNFIDGMIIASSYLISIPLGIAATIGVLFHEIPQEIADFGILLYSGWEKKKAILFNFLSALMSIFGAILAILLSNHFDTFLYFIMPFAAGNFLYIAASNLVPELHRHCNFKETFLHLFAILVGIIIMVLLV